MTPPPPPARPGTGGFLLRLLALGLASRVLVLAVGWAVVREDDAHAAYLAKFAGDPRTVAELRGEPRLVRAWYRWDALWYAAIARDGYSPGPAPAAPHPSMAFLPLLPAVMRAGQALGLDRYRVGLAAPNLAFAAGLALFGLVALRATGDAASAGRACLLLAAYPWSFYFSAPYNESLAFALATAALLAWVSHRPVRAGLCLGVATASRLTAAAMSCAVVVEWFDDAAHRRAPRRDAWPVAAFGLAGALAFFGFLHLRFGDPMLHLKAHRLPPWSRGSPHPMNVLRALANPPTGLARLKDYAAMLLFLALGARAWVKRGPFWGCLILVPLLQAMSSGTVLSVARVTLACAPAFIDLGELLRNRWALAVWLAASLALQVVLTRHFVNLGF